MNQSEDKTIQEKSGQRLIKIIEKEAARENLATGLLKMARSAVRQPNSR